MNWITQILRFYLIKSWFYWKSVDELISFMKFFFKNPSLSTSSVIAVNLTFITVSVYHTVKLFQALACWVTDREGTKCLRPRRKVSWKNRVRHVSTKKSRFWTGGKRAYSRGQTGRSCKQRHPSNSHTTILHWQSGLRPLIIRKNRNGNETGCPSKKFIKLK